MALTTHHFFAGMQFDEDEGKGSKAGPAQAKAAKGKPKAAQTKKKRKDEEVSGEVHMPALTKAASGP